MHILGKVDDEEFITSHYIPLHENGIVKNSA